MRAHAQYSQIQTIQVQNQGSTLKTFAAPFKLNCSSNMTCSVSGNQVSLAASSTASTAFSALTGGTNSNLGTFAASGNSWDFTGSTIFKLRAAAGLTTSAAGDIGEDTTTGYWHFYNSVKLLDELLIAATNVGTSGQPCLSNADGTCTFADPVVSGSHTPADAYANATDAVNVFALGGVWNGTGWDRMYGDKTNGLFVDVKALPSLPAGSNAIGSVSVSNFPASQTVAQPSGANLHADIDNFPATQPVSGTVTANAGTGFPAVNPCQSATPTFVAISVTANSQLLTGVAAKQTYICSINLVSASADNVAIVEGTGSTCGTGTAGVKGLSGGVTAATGWNFGANGGLTFGSGGFAIGATTTAADNICILVSGATQVSGGLSYVQQ